MTHTAAMSLAGYLRAMKKTHRADELAGLLSATLTDPATAALPAGALRSLLAIRLLAWPGIVVGDDLCALLSRGAPETTTAEAMADSIEVLVASGLVRSVVAGSSRQLVCAAVPGLVPDDDAPPAEDNDGRLSGAERTAYADAIDLIPGERQRVRCCVCLSGHSVEWIAAPDDAGMGYVVGRGMELWDAALVSRLGWLPPDAEEMPPAAAVCRGCALEVLVPQLAAERGGASSPAEGRRLVAAPDTGAIRRVFDAWVAATGRTQAKLTDSRRRAIARALRDYSERDLIDAVGAWKRDAFYAGRNDRRTVYNDIELILRDARRIEHFLFLARQDTGIATASPSSAEAWAAGSRRA